MVRDRFHFASVKERSPLLTFMDDVWLWLANGGLVVIVIACAGLAGACLAWMGV